MYGVVFEALRVGFSSINVDKRRPPASSKNGLHRGVRGTARSSAENPINHNRRQRSWETPPTIYAKEHGGRSWEVLVPLRFSYSLGWRTSDGARC